MNSHPRAIAHPDFQHCRSLRPTIPPVVTFGEFDANLNTGYLAAHVEYKTNRGDCPDSWLDMKKRNFGQWKNYQTMIEMAETAPVYFITDTGKEARHIRRQIAVLCWHDLNPTSDGFGFDAVTDVVAYQIMYYWRKEPTSEPVLTYSPVISTCGRYDCWENFIFQLFGLTNTQTGMKALPNKATINLLDGQNYHI